MSAPPAAPEVITEILVPKKAEEVEEEEEVNTFLSRRRATRANQLFSDQLFTDKVDMDMEGIVTEAASINRCHAIGMILTFFVVVFYWIFGAVRIWSLDEIPATKVLMEPTFRKGNYVPMPGLAMCVLGNRNLTLQHADFCRSISSGDRCVDVMSSGVHSVRVLVPRTASATRLLAAGNSCAGNTSCFDCIIANPYQRNALAFQFMTDEVTASVRVPGPSSR
jgi:hypothetical protein